MSGGSRPRVRRILPGVRRLARELGVASWNPELLTAERLARSIDDMSDEDAARMLGQTVPPLLRALSVLRAQAAPAAASGEPERGLTDAQLAEFLDSLEADHGAE